MTATSIQPKYEAIHDHDRDDNEKKHTTTDTVAAIVVTTEEEDEVLWKPLTLEQRHRTTRRAGGCRCVPRTCCGVCCCISLTLFALLMLLFVAIFVAYYALLVTGVRMITVETPVAFPTENIYTKELDAFGNDADVFIQAILNNDGNDSIDTPDLVISSHVVNGAIAQCDYLKGHAQVTMKENEFIFQTSLPMDMFPGGKHRFFVSTMDTTTAATTAEPGSTVTTTSFDLAKKLTEDYDGPLFVTELLTYLATTTAMTANASGKDHPEWVLNALSMNVMGQELVTPDAQGVDLLQALRDDPNFASDPNNELFFKFINGIGSIKLEPDRMIVRARQNDPTGTGVMIEASAVTEEETTTASDDDAEDLASIDDAEYVAARKGDVESSSDFVTENGPKYLRH